jgi:hypothetical protein
VKRGALIRAGGLAAAVGLALPTLASAQTTDGNSEAQSFQAPAVKASPKATHATVVVKTTHVHGGSLKVGNYAGVVAKLRPYVKGEKLKLLLRRDGHTIKQVKRAVHKVHGGNGGRVSMRTKKLTAPGRYRVLAVHNQTSELPKAKGSARGFHIRYPAIHGGSSEAAGIFNHLLNKNGYGNAPNGNAFSDGSRRAVLAFRKVNGMARTTQATPEIFKMLADGRGAFKPVYGGAGRHVEVDISRQVMALIDHGKALYTYHVSTGAPATPTVRGHYRFYRKSPGFNSEGMYYSVYFFRGYATHGYHSVPTYNASHGCVRNPIPDSKFIYDWINLGESIYVYG